MIDQSFVIRKSVAQQAKIAFVVTVLISGFLVFQLFRMLLDVCQTRDLWALGFLVLMAFGFTWYFYHVMKSAPYRSISIDADGLWQSHEGKAVGLVRWTDILCIQEDGFLDNLSLIGPQGNTLVKVAYGLDGFQQLRTLISERMAFQPPSLPKTFRSKPGPIIAFICMTIFFIVMAWLFFTNDDRGFGFLFLAFGMFFGFISVSGIKNRVVIEHDRIRLGSRIFPFSEITSVSIRDRVIRDQTFSSVRIDLSPTPIKREALVLGSLNIDSLTLQRTILWAIKQSSQSSHTFNQSGQMMSVPLQIEGKASSKKRWPILLLLVNSTSWILVFLSLLAVFHRSIALKLFDPETAKYVFAVALTSGTLASLKIVRFIQNNQNNPPNT